MTEKAREARVRRTLRRHSLLVRKSRMFNPNPNDMGGYMLMNERNCVVAGGRHEWTLDDLEARAAEEAERKLEALADARGQVKSTGQPSTRREKTT